MKLCEQCGKKYQDGIAFCPRDGQQLVEYLPPDGDQDPLIGAFIEKKYRIEDKIAQGGMSTIYLATHAQLDLPVAVKVLHERLVPDENAIRRFRREAQSAMQIRHTNAITVMDFGVTESNIVYLVMEYLQGMTLRDKLNKEPLLPFAQINQILQQICAAVKVAHRRGIVHRDLKPDNIFLQRDEEGEIVKVLDFGIAKLENFNTTLELQLQRAEHLLGSPHYMSPEQWSNEEISVRSDIYSLGVMLFELLTGQLPFSAPNMAALAYKHTVEKPPTARSIRPDLPANLDALVARMLEKDPALRPEDAGALAEELDAAFAPALAPEQSKPEALASSGTGTGQLDPRVLSTLSGTSEWPKITIPTTLEGLDPNYSLDSIFLPEIFGLLARERVTGVSWFSSGLVVKGLFWEEGEIVFAVSSDLSEQFGERIVRQGRMQRKQLNTAIKRQNETNENIIDALVSLDYVTKEALMPLLSAHVYSACYSLLDWEEGIYAFDPSLYDLPVKVSLPAGELILEAVRSILDMGRIKAFLGRPERTCLASSDLERPKRINLRHDEITILDRLKEPLYISQLLVELDLPEGQIMRTLCGLLALGALRRVDGESSGPITDEILISDTASRNTGEMQVVETTAATSSSASLSEDAATASTPYDVAAMAMFCYEVENMLVHVNRQGIDYYGILEVARQASPDEIKTAFNQYMQKYDIESNKNIIEQMPMLSPQLETIRARLTEAYETLSDQNKRIKYTQQLKQQTGRLSARSSQDSAPRLEPSPPPATTAPAASSPPAVRQTPMPAPPKPAPPKPIPPPKPIIEEMSRPSENIEKGLPAAPKAFGDPSRLRNPDDWYLFGLELLESGDPQRAVRAFQNALKRRPRDAEFHAALARAYSEMQGYSRQAILEFEEAIALQPKSADYQAELGIYYLKQNQIEEAKRCIDSALALDVGNRMANKAKTRIDQMQ